MLTLRPAQIHEFLQGDEPAFVDAILAQLRQSHPTWRQTDAMLRDSIRVGIKRARRNGLSSDRHISEFVLIMGEVAPNFDQQKDIRRMLDDANLPVEARWERLFTPEFDAAWEEADQPGFLDPNAWFDTPPPGLGEAELPTPQDWAEWLAIARIQAQTPPGSPVREPGPQEIEAARRELEARLPPAPR